MKRLLFFVILIASTAHGEVFTWTDSQGTAHFTNSFYEIPARYRAKVKVLNMGTESKPDGPVSVQQAPQAPQTPMPIAVEQQKPREAPTKGRQPRRRARESDE